MVDEKKYPMNLDEFEKRCTELLIEVLGEHRREKIFKFMQSNHDYVERLYLDTCGFYEDEEIYGELCKQAFTDKQLKVRAVDNLYMLYGD